jgi:hypothetical protein
MHLLTCESMGVSKWVNEWMSECMRACMRVRERERGTHNWHSSFHIGFKVSSLTEVLQWSVLLEVKYTVQNGLLRPA